VTIGLGEERQLFGSDGLNIPSIQEGNDAVFNTVNQIFGALRIPLNVRNPFRRSQATDRASGIGNSCRTTVECVAQSPNSVCYDGRCLCNLGYHYVSRVDQCIKDNTCPVCDNPVNTCLGGQDVYCNGSCFSDYRTEMADKAKKQIASPNWPNEYSPETDKFVCVQANTGKRVHLDLIWLDMETGCGHSCDYIKVYDGCVANDSSNLLAFYTGDNAGNRQQVTSNCNKMMIHFHSDKDDGGATRSTFTKATGDEDYSKDQRSGFMGYYREIDYDEKVCACANP
jgi:hypothetical protein